MTNREVLFNSTDEKLSEFLCSEYFTRLKLSYTQSTIGIQQWLGQTATEYTKNILGVAEK